MNFPARYTGSWKRSDFAAEIRDPLVSVKELEPKFIRQKSYAKKAHVVGSDGVVALYSYATNVMQYDVDTKVLHVGKYAAFSPTTLRHVRDFLQQYGIKFDLGIKNIKAHLGEEVETV